MNVPIMIKRQQRQLWLFPCYIFFMQEKFISEFFGLKVFSSKVGCLHHCIALHVVMKTESKIFPKRPQNQVLFHKGQFYGLCYLLPTWIVFLYTWMAFTNLIANDTAQCELSKHANFFLLRNDVTTLKILFMSASFHWIWRGKWW